MTIDGFFSAHMTGADSQGFAMFILQDGVIVGSDPLGVSFDGHYEVESQTGRLRGQVSVKAPAGGLTVQGVNTGPHGINYTLPIDLPSNFLELEYIRLETPLGPVNMALKKVRDLR